MSVVSPRDAAASLFENTPQAYCKSVMPRSASHFVGSPVASALQTPPCVFESTSLCFQSARMQGLFNER
jgi:hypothetical protein